MLGTFVKMLDDQDPGGNGNETPITPGGDGQRDWKTEYEKLSKTSQSSYAGLQKTLQKVQGDYEKLKTTHAGVAEQFGLLQSTHTTVQQALDAVTAEREQFKPELDTLRTFKARTTLIHEKFPNLVKFEAKGLLPDGKPEELEAKFTAFQAELGDLNKVLEKENKSGGTPPPPAGGGETPSSAEELLKLAIAASAVNDMTGFDKYYDLYLKAKPK
jgi:uncharacterized phage infection (PIP) family protein YhgE